MTTCMEPSSATLTEDREIELVTFAIGDRMFAAKITEVSEINRNLDLVPAPNAPPWVRGVINLRGEVVSVVDLRVLFSLPPAALTRETRNVLLYSKGERIGLWVDGVGDVIRCRSGDLEDPPANFSGADGLFVKQVHKHGNDLILLLDCENALSRDREDAEARRV